MSNIPTTASRPGRGRGVHAVVVSGGMKCVPMIPFVLAPQIANPIGECPERPRTRGVAQCLERDPCRTDGMPAVDASCAAPGSIASSGVGWALAPVRAHQRPRRRTRGHPDRRVVAQEQQHERHDGQRGGGITSVAARHPYVSASHAVTGRKIN